MKTTTPERQTTHRNRSLSCATPSRSRLLRLLALTLCPFLTHTALAQTWQTVDDSRYFGHSAYLNAMGKDPFGNVYALGYGTSNNFDDLALITKSSDGGATWSVSDAFGITPHSEVCEYLAMTSDGVGNLYALGEGWDNTSQHWFVRRSQDSGATWATVLDVPYTGYIAFPNWIATDAAGNVFVAGPTWVVLRSADAGNSWDIVDAFNPGRSPAALGVLCHPTLGIFAVGGADAATTIKKNTTYQRNWYVRRSLNGGATWTTVDAFPCNGLARRIVADASGKLYVMGNTDGHWIIRKSANGGTAWTTVDDFFPHAGTTNYTAMPWGLDVDSHGSVFVAGSLTQSYGPAQWVVRKLPVGSVTWQTVDTFQYAPSHTSRANGLVADDFGNVFAGGIGMDASSVNGSPHWLVRKLVP